MVTCIACLTEHHAIAAGLFPFRTHMTKDKMKMGYIEVETQQGCNLFPPNCKARGHVYHFSEILQEKVVGGFNHGRVAELEWETGYQATMQVGIAPAVHMADTTAATKYGTLDASVGL